MICMLDTWNNCSLIHTLPRKQPSDIVYMSSAVAHEMFVNACSLDACGPLAVAGFTPWLSLQLVMSHQREEVETRMLKEQHFLHNVYAQVHLQLMPRLKIPIPLPRRQTLVQIFLDKRRIQFHVSQALCFAL
eukprot:m.58534 g.58534  ORF g.58534 m.58534 type:complete len:132 (+) comp11699_c0_seq1:46-441(+)